MLKSMTFRSTLAAVACAISFSAYAIADQPRQIDIPSGELFKALLQLSNQYGADLVYRPEQVYGLKTPGAHGSLTSEQAVTKLLEGTKLQVHTDNSTGAMIIAMPGTVGVQSANAGSKEVSNESKDKEGTESKSLSDRFRMAQVDKGKVASPTAVADSETHSQVPSQRSTSLEEVVVTAQKREERLSNTPLSVTALSAGDLDRLGAVNFRDFANTVPGVNFSTTGAGKQNVISMRGVSLGLGATVGIYVDDVPFGSSSALAAGQVALDVGLFDVDRIEVLRGPQGTLYGASAMGGLIKYVTTGPDTSAFGGSARTLVSSTEHGGVSYSAAGSVNVPLSADTAAVRLGGYESHDGGYIDNVALRKRDVNRGDTYGGRFDFLLRPMSNLSIRIGGLFQNSTTDGTLAADYSSSGVPVLGDLQQSRFYPEPATHEFRLVNATVNANLGWADLTSVSSYQTTNLRFLTDFTAAFGLPPGGGALGYVSTTITDKFTQEIRLASRGQQQLEWLIGGFYTKENTGNNQAFDPRDPAGAALPNTLLTYANPSHFKESAVFGDLTYHLTSKLGLTGGVRYANNRQDSIHIESGAFGVSNPLVKSSENVTTYLAGAQYHLTDRAMAYVRYATGYRPGGPNFITKNPVSGVPSGPTSFESDRLKSYEIGFKSNTVDRRYAVDLAAYQIDWSNIQLTKIFLIDGVPFGFLVNAPGGVTVRGGELSLTARPEDHFTATASLAYQGATLNQADLTLGARKGERLPGVPRLSGALNLEYKLSDTGITPSVGATVRYVGDRTSSFDNGALIGNPQYHLPSYAAVDLRASAIFGPVDLQLFVHNVADRRGQLSDGNRVVEQVSIMQPRTFGLQASTRF